MSFDCFSPGLGAINCCVARNFLYRKGLIIQDCFRSLPFQSVIDILDDDKLVADEMHVSSAPYRSQNQGGSWGLKPVSFKTLSK